MKKLIYLFSLAFLILQSCSSGSTDNTVSSSSSQLVGKWEAYQVGSFPPGTVINSSTPLINYQFACPTLKDYYQFGSQGTIKVATYN